MNNMEAINEFSPESKYFQEEEQYDGCFTNDMPLEYLYLNDCLSELFGENLLSRGVHVAEYQGGKMFPNSHIRLYDDRKIELNLSQKIDENRNKFSKAEFDYENFGSAKMEVKESEIPDFDKLVEICQTAISNFPQVYQELRKGTYDKEKHSPAKLLLQQKDAELCSLEAEEKTISEAEALRDKQNQKQGEQK